MVVSFAPNYTLDNLSVVGTAVFNEISFQSYTGTIPLKGPTGSSGQQGPTGAGLGYASFATGGIVFAKSSTGLYTSSHFTFNDTSNKTLLDGSFQVLSSQITGASTNQFIYNSYGYQTFTFSPVSGTNAIQTFTTHPLVNQVIIECWGAGGGGGYGGNGGYSISTISGLSGPHTFKLWVGNSNEGGETLGHPESVPSIILATGPARYFDYLLGGVTPYTGYDKSITFFITGATGSQTYNIETIY